MLLCARHCFRHEDTNMNETEEIPAFVKLTLTQETASKQINNFDRP